MSGSFAVMTAARFDHHTLVRLAEADEIDMRTPRADGTASSRPIWIVVVDGVPYVRSYAGERGAWYQHAPRDGRAEVGVDPVTPAARPVTAADGEPRGPPAAPPAGGADDHAWAHYHDKYGRRSPGPTEAMVTPQVVAT